MTVNSSDFENITVPFKDFCGDEGDASTSISLPALSLTAETSPLTDLRPTEASLGVPPRRDAPVGMRALFVGGAGELGYSRTLRRALSWGNGDGENIMDGWRM